MEIPQSTTLVLSAKHVTQIVQKKGLEEIMDTLIRRMEMAFQNFNSEKIDIPVRSGFHYDLPEQGLIEWMPLHEKGKEILIKVVGYHAKNPDKYNKPTILSTISTYDTQTGHLLAIMDGVFLTALRTGAASALASKYLAAKDSSTLGLIGCGAQAVTQLHAISRLFDLKKVMYYDIEKEALDSFQSRVELLGLDVVFEKASMAEVVSASDILCTATSIDVGTGPLFNNVETQDWLHVNALGSDFPGKTELPLNLLKQSYVCPDFLGQALVEGECQQLKPEGIGDDIFTCIQNENKYIDLKNKRTVFDSTGLALEDQVIAKLFLDYARELSLGFEIEIEQIPENAKNPYHFMMESKTKNSSKIIKLN